MFRVDLFVISLIIVTIVEIHMLIFDVCVSKHNSFFAHIFFFQNCLYYCWISNCRISGLCSPIPKWEVKHIVKYLDSERESGYYTMKMTYLKHIVSRSSIIVE